MASPSSVLTEGFGAWGGVGLLPTLGYGIGAAAATDHRPSFGLWAREPGRGKWAVESGRGLEMLDQAEWLGTYRLPSGGPSGGKRRFFVYFGNMEEIADDGETLTGTPTVDVDGDGTLPDVTDIAFNVAPMTIRINGNTILADAGTVLLFTVAAGTAAAGDYTLSFHADTTGGYIFEPTATLNLE